MTRAFNLLNEDPTFARSYILALKLEWLCDVDAKTLLSISGEECFPPYT